VMANMQYADVSSWQGTINWDKYPFKRVAIRAGYGNTGVDVQFKRNWAEAKAREIARQAYWFHQPGHDIHKHLQTFFSLLGNDPGECELLWDAESLGNLSSATSLKAVFLVDPDKDNSAFIMGGYYGAPRLSMISGIFQRNAIAGLKNALLDELYKAKDGIKAEYGRFPEMYTNNGFWNTYVTPSDIERDCDLDIAHWNVLVPSIPTGWANRGKKQTDWQKEVIKGGGPAWGMVSQDVDHQEFNGDVEAFNKWAGTNIVPPPPPEPPPGGDGLQTKFIALINGQNVRSEPSTAQGTKTVVGHLMAGQVLFPLRDVFVAGQNAVWFKFDRGWIAAVYGGSQFLKASAG
jgi:Glycosyl hydrolases family 25